MSIYDLLLVTTAATALLVCYGALAPRALVYTAGFIGGLVGTALALNRSQPRVFEVICMGVAFGMAGGYVAALAIEALQYGILFESAWKSQFRKGPVPATEYAALYGLIGGVAASALSIALSVFKGWVRQQRERDALNDAE